MEYVWAYIIGGLFCVIGQILIDKTKLTPARILVIYVVSGVFLTLIGVYEPIVKFAGAGATVPLTGFGYALCNGVIKAVREQGFLGIFTGGLTATAGGIAAAIVFGFIFALIFRPKEK
ncbi:MAG: stage V sporulation protein AE [Bacillota bacterium]|nr:stage V sporulation protein AE [Bacillota bacterium]